DVATDRDETLTRVPSTLLTLCHRFLGGGLVRGEMHRDAHAFARERLSDASPQAATGTSDQNNGDFSRFLAHGDAYSNTKEAQDQVGASDGHEAALESGSGLAGAGRAAARCLRAGIAAMAMKPNTASPNTNWKPSS